MELLPSGVAAAGWIPFTVVLLLTILFSVIYTRYFRHRKETDVISFLTVVLALSASLLTSALLPVDIFLASYMKYPNGTFKDWASNSSFRHNVEDSLLYAYYSLYSILLLFGFLILPFVYFFYEEKDDAVDNTSERICSSIKYTAVFLLLAAVLLTVGAFIPLRPTANVNSTEWEKIEYLIKELSTTRGEDALGFVLSILTAIGMITLIFYTASGLATFPISLIRGTRSVAKERSDVGDNRSATQARISLLRERVRGTNANPEDLEKLNELEQQHCDMMKQERYLDNIQRSISYKCRILVRPFQIFIGAGCCLLGLLLWVSLLLTNIDKAMNSLGYKYGYVLLKRTLPNPLDIVLVYSQRVFPIDYILFVGIVLFLALCTIYGIQRLGIWFLFVRLYKIRPGKTRPQGMFMLCLTLMYTVLALNILLYSVSPQYTTYGSQHFVVNSTSNSTDVASCNSSAAPDDCTMTRASALLERFFYKAWIFGACYYWGLWIFLAMSVIGFGVSVFRARRSAIDGRVEADEFEDSDDDHLLVA